MSSHGPDEPASHHEPSAPAESAAPSAPDSPDALAASAEYPPEVWPRLYGAVLGLLVLDMVVFGLVTAYFS